MRLALALGARHLGLTWPNPSVGAVVVDTSGAVPVIVAQASAQPGGRPHAERVALTEAGERATGRDALRLAGALLASRPVAALRRCDS